MSALSCRQSLCDFSPDPLADQLLSDLLGAGGGIHRHDVDGRTPPGALHAQVVLLDVTMPQGLFLYVPKMHALRPGVASDVRRVTGNQDFVDTAPRDLVFFFSLCVRLRTDSGLQGAQAGGCSNHRCTS